MKILLPRRLMVIVLLGFASGLPIALVTSTLSAWYTQAGISLVAIGCLTLVGQPYVYKFLWAPLIDRYDPLGLGRRRSWMLLSQIALMLFLILMSLLDPNTHPGLLAFIAVCVALCSATQDIAITAYLTEGPALNERGLASSFYTSTYRLALILGNTGALILASYAGWKISYLTMALLMSMGLLGTFLTPEPATPPQLPAQPFSYQHIFIAPFLDLVKRFGAGGLAAILIVLVLYKLTDAFALSMSSVFFLRTLHYSLVNVGLVNKVFGTCAVILGSLVAGISLRSLKLFPALIGFGVLQALANLVFIWLFYTTHTVTHFAIAVFIDNFFSGLASTAFLALLLSLSSQTFAGTQLALLSALTAIGRVYVGPLAGLSVALWGWPSFFGLAIFIGLIGTASIWLVKAQLIPNPLKKHIN
jgi:PAT family beta-lactamase induction signal transducer AmpG